jgi:hypothetical protein
MGLVALAIAGAVIWEDVRPRSRLIALLLPVLLLAQSIFLLEYNEDLPWFLGYREVDATPPKGGVLARAPSGRAELVFHPGDGQIQVFFWKPKKAEWVGMPNKYLDGTIITPREKFHVILSPGESIGEATQPFVALIERLKNVSLFTLRLNIPRTRLGRKATVVAEFDPVVTAPILPPLVGAEKVYGCPMCADVLSSKPALCPMCGMELVDVPRSRMLQKPQFGHDERYTMRVLTEPKPREKERTDLTFSLQDKHSGSVVKDFRTVHEKQMHLFIVSKDLLWFFHVHPEPQEDGRFVLPFQFPQSGEYLLFSDVTPEGSPMQVFRQPVNVEGTPRVLQPLHEMGDYLAQVIGGCHINMLPTPNPPQARSDVQLTFSIAKEGKPVDDLEPFLGATGHCVIIHEDTETFIHSHPVQLTAASPTPGGPEVAFHAYLPKPGLYKVWGQFNRHGTVLTADFVIRAD